MGYSINRSRHRGVAIFYVIVTLIAMLGFCSLAVDLGRVQTAKTELRRAADAAARAGAAFIPSGLSAVQTEAVAVAGQNKVDGASFALNTSDVTLGTVTVSGVQCQAVTVTIPAGQVKIPLLFGAILGSATCDVTATSVAALVASPTSTTQSVSAHGDPWLAGQPAGTLGSEPDNGYDNPKPNNSHPWKNDIADPAAVASAVDSAGSNFSNYSPPEDPNKVASTDYANDEPYGSPTQFTVTPGSVVGISIPASGFADNNQGFLTSNNASNEQYDATGSNNGTYSIYSDDAANPNLSQGTNTTSGTEHGLSNIEAPLDSVIGVFMDQNGTTYGADSTEETTEANAPSTPSGLNFSNGSGTQTSTTVPRDYSALQPQVNQTFYAGDGQANGAQQLLFVPSTASSLFLGTMDGHEWSNNTGGGEITVTVYQIELVK